MTFKIEITPKKDTAGLITYEVAVTLDIAIPSTTTTHSFSTIEAAEQFKKAQVNIFLEKK
jgi:hypothetical protein